MTEKKVPYQVNGRQFEGMIVYDDSVKAKRPSVFMQPDWKGVCADTIGSGPHRRRQRLCRADGRHVRRGLRPKTEDTG